MKISSNMKNIKNILFALLALCMASCDLLDVSPRQERRQSDLFEHESGYKEALIGVYTRIASANLYGANTSFYLPELLARTWSEVSTQANPEDEAFRNWDFTDKNAEGRISRIWSEYYRSIAELNNILDNIDQSEGVFSNGNYELVKGEALGLRAFLHLDLLRLFGPVPGPQAAGASAIPYADVFSKNPNNYLTLNYSEVTERIIRDLNAAEELLANDPFTQGSVLQMQMPNIAWNERPQDSWQYYRQVRFNYYAVLATKARFYDWTGDKENAVKYAEQLIKTEKFTLVNSDGFTPGYASGDFVSLVFVPEQLFAVHNPKHQDLVNTYFINTPVRLTQSSDAIMAAYEASQQDTRNVPGRYWTGKESNYGSSEHFMKYSGSARISSPNKVPLLRISEMYFIAIMNLPVTDARVKQYFSDYQSARNISQSFIEEMNDETLRAARMEKEYRKEFMGEGQMFYFYKKHGYTQYAWPDQFTIPAAHQNYMLPKPLGQISFE